MMPKIHVIYDPKDTVITPTDEAMEKMGMRVAVLSVPADLKYLDIYNLARRLAELLLEQVK